jgi:hypothetical protein
LEGGWDRDGDFFNNKKITVGFWWLMPVILATWEVEIRRILVQGQPR